MDERRLEGNGTAGNIDRTKEDRVLLRTSHHSKSVVLFTIFPIVEHQQSILIALSSFVQHSEPVCW